MSSISYVCCYMESLFELPESNLLVTAIHARRKDKKSLETKTNVLTPCTPVTIHTLVKHSNRVCLDPVFTFCRIH